MIMYLMQVPVTFSPREKGFYTQYWDVEFDQVRDGRAPMMFQVELCGQVGRSAHISFNLLPQILNLFFF